MDDIIHELNTAIDRAKLYQDPITLEMVQLWRDELQNIVDRNDLHDDCYSLDYVGENYTRNDELEEKIEAEVSKRITWKGTPEFARNSFKIVK